MFFDTACFFSGIVFGVFRCIERLSASKKIYGQHREALRPCLRVEELFLERKEEDCKKKLCNSASIGLSWIFPITVLERSRFPFKPRDPKLIIIVFILDL